jgi:hypothetical protein
VAPTFGALLEDAYSWLKEKMTFDEDRKKAIDEGVTAIVRELGALPVAVTQPFKERRGGTAVDRHQPGRLQILWHLRWQLRVRGAETGSAGPGNARCGP